MASADPLDSLSTSERVKTLLEDFISAHDRVHVAMQDERRFVWDLEQYYNDTGNTKNRDRVQPRDQAPLRLALYQASKLLKAPPYFRTSASNAKDAKNAAKVKWARWALEDEFTRVTSRLSKKLRATVLSGLTSRMGVLYASWNSDNGPYGNIEYAVRDSRCVMWSPGFSDPHDPQCSQLIDYFRMPTAKVRKMKGWKNTADVEPDDGFTADSARSTATDISGVVDFDQHTKPDVDKMETQRFTTIVFLWERVMSKDAAPKVTRKLPEAERYMQVSDGPMKGKRVQYTPPDGQPMPEVDITEDGLTLKRVDTEEVMPAEAGYPKLKLTICAPYSAGGKVFYEGKAPQPMRTFPYLVWQPYENPFHQIGTSDVDLNYTMTLVKNGTVRRWYEQLHEARGIMLIPGRGITNYAGQTFQYTNADGIAAIYDSQFPPEGVRYIPGPQPSPQLAQFYHTIDQIVSKYDGSSQLSAEGTAESLKGVAVGTIERATQTGNVSSDDFKSTWDEELGLFAGVIHDIQRARYTEARDVRYLGADGRTAYQAMRGDDIPECDVRVTARPTLDVFNSAKLDTLTQLAQLARENPVLARIAARDMDLDPDDAAEILSSSEHNGPPPAPPSTVAALLTAVAAADKAAPGVITPEVMAQILAMAGIQMGEPGAGTPPPPGGPGAGGPPPGFAGAPPPMSMAA